MKRQVSMRGHAVARQASPAMLAAALGLSFGMACAQDAADGRLLYETHCNTCHTPRLHERDSRRSKVQTREDLRQFVERWARETGRRFTAAELAAVAEYLDASYYRLPR